MAARADVFLLPAAVEAPAAEALVATGGLAELVSRLGLAGRARADGRWCLKLQVGEPGRGPAIAPAWAAAVAGALAGGHARGRVTCCDTLSFTTPGLDTVEGYLAEAARQGYGAAAGGPDFALADDPAAGPGFRPAGADDLPTLAALTAAAAGLLVLAPVRPHPHLGFAGALHGLGVGLADREGKVLLHRDVRPRVDTPLCAGCGSCLAVCIHDAIRLEGGRALIDHQLCTGCGECMNVCFMAGIAPEDAARIPAFQERVAGAARAALAGTAAGPRPTAFLNFLVRLDRRAGGPGRRRDRLGDVGVLASRDPVALDRATWDLAEGGPGGSLQAWSGFPQVPGPLLARAEALGLGTAAYRLVSI